VPLHESVKGSLKLGISAPVFHCFFNGERHSLLLADARHFGQARQRGVLLFGESKCHGHEDTVPP